MNQTGADWPDLIENERKRAKSMECIKYHKHCTEDDGSKMLNITCLESGCGNQGMIAKGIYYQLRARSGV